MKIEPDRVIALDRWDVLKLLLGRELKLPGGDVIRVQGAYELLNLKAPAAVEVAGPTSRPGDRPS